MTRTYQEHFAQRGSAYDRAMGRFPQARSAEFRQAIEAAPLGPGLIVADVPAGGGYLQQYLPAGCRWLGHEPCGSFTNHGLHSEQAVHLLPLPWADNSVDAAISLAGVHHIDDKRLLFAELHRVVRPGGVLIVSDVAAGSDVARFLDGYVGAHNSTGHAGVFLDERTCQELAQAAWSVMQDEVKDFHWIFCGRADMAAFCHELFDIRTATQADTLQAIASMLGVDELSDGGVGMRWSLRTLVAAKARRCA